jgi:serine protease Do
MKLWSRVALAAALCAAAGAGAAMAPVAHGQTFAWAAAPQALQVLSGGGRIGVSIRDVAEEDVKRGKLSGTGVVIEDVSRDSPAEKAGLRSGDVVTEFDGERVRSARQFTRLVQETPAGRPVPLTVVRDGQKTTLTVEPTAGDGFTVYRDLDRLRIRPAPVPPTPPARPFSRVIPDVEEFFRTGRSLGITVSDLSSQLAEYFGAKDGVLVTSVITDSAAAKAGLRAGDVITSINGTAVDDAANLRRETQRMDAGAEFTLQIVRDKKAMALKGKLEERTTPRRTIRTVRTIRTTV